MNDGLIIGASTYGSTSPRVAHAASRAEKVASHSSSWVIGPPCFRFEAVTSYLGAAVPHAASGRRQDPDPPLAPQQLRISRGLVAPALQEVDPGERGHDRVQRVGGGDTRGAQLVGDLHPRQV